MAQMQPNTLQQTGRQVGRRSTRSPSTARATCRPTSTSTPSSAATRTRQADAIGVYAKPNEEPMLRAAAAPTGDTHCSGVRRAPGRATTEDGRTARKLERCERSPGCPNGARSEPNSANATGQRI